MVQTSTETMSNPSDWLQLYNTLPSTQDQLQAPPASHHDATLVSTVATPSALNPSSSNNNNSLSPEGGRVSKPVRKRTRASRRTPTTLLNTDTANFRAMVQQFTGGPTTASFAGPTSAASFGFRQGFVNNPNANSLMVPPGYNNNHIHLQQQQQSSYQQGFVQRLMSSSLAIRPTTTNNLGISFSSDEFGSQVVQARQASNLVAGSVRPNSNAANEIMGAIASCIESDVHKVENEVT